jgi:hypothetical protein
MRIRKVRMQTHLGFFGSRAKSVRIRGVQVSRDSVKSRWDASIGAKCRIRHINSDELGVAGPLGA